MVLSGMNLSQFLIIGGNEISSLRKNSASLEYLAAVSGIEPDLCKDQSMSMKWLIKISVFLILGFTGTMLAGSAKARTLESEDDFLSGDYTGGAGWSGDWIESGDDGTAGGGDITVAGNQLQFVGDGGGNGFISRAVDPDAFSTDGGALLFFQISFDGTLETTDIFEVYASADGGTTWTEIRQFNGQVPFEGGTTSRDMTLDISEFIGANTAIRFGVASGVTDAGEAFNIDNVEIFSTQSVLDLETDEFFGGTALPTASSSNSTDEAQIFDASNQPYSDDGLVISETSGATPGPIMIFDTSDPTGGDTDLGAPNGDNNSNGINCGANAGIGPSLPGDGGDANGDGFNDAALGSAGENCRPLGNTLIFSTDGDATEPNDDAGGATISFDFDAPVEFGALRFIDDLAGSVSLRFDGGGTESKNFNQLIDFPGQGENGVFFASFKDFVQNTNVIGIDVTLNGSGTVGTLFGQPPGIDLADAPDTYGTDLTVSAGEGVGPSHRIDPGNRPLHLGSAPDSEPDGQPSADAQGDDAGGIPSTSAGDFDDEDGVTFDSTGTLGPGATFTTTLTTTNQTGSPALACGWIDFNDNGVFDNADATGGANNAERICISVPSGTMDQQFDLDFIIPNDFVFDGGADGRFFSRFRITTDWSASSEAAAIGPASDGEVEDFEIPLESLPVSIHSFSTRAGERGLVVEWGTASETRNAGFAIWGDRGNGLELLTPEFIASTAVDAAQAQRYTHELTGVGAEDFERLFLTAVDLNGNEKIYGDFAPGVKYGEELLPSPIPWAEIQARSSIRVAELEALQASSPGLAELGAPPTAVDVTVDGAGMHEITHAELIGAGLNLTGVAAERIAVSLKDRGVAREVTGGETFGPGSTIRFWAEAPGLPDSLYLEQYSYRVAEAPDQVVQAGSLIGEFTGFVASFESSPPVTEVGTFQARQRDSRDVAYSMFNEADDPWYMARLRADRSNTHVSEFELDDQAALEQGARLRVRVIGSTDFPESPDHRIAVEVNGQQVVQRDFEGNAVVDIEAELATGVLQPGANTIQVIAPGGTQAAFDISLLDSVELIHARRLIASNGWLLAESRAPTPTDDLVVAGFADSPVLAYARAGEELIALNVEALGGGNYRVDSLEQPADYWISDASGFKPVSQVRAVAPVDLSQFNEADFVIIGAPPFLPLSADEAHPLNDFIDARRAEGWRPVVFNIEDIQRQFGFGMPLPEAVPRFLAALDAHTAYEHVLLVGGDSYDYLDHLEMGALSFIPTLYRNSQYIPHAPADPLLADLDGDGRPDKALGRWPVRTVDDLEAIVTKTLDWSEDSSALNRAVWITDSQDPSQPSFIAQAGELSDTLQQSGWPASAISSVYWDDVVPPPGISTATAARETYFELLEQGRSLSGFVGHGAPTMWTFQGLLTPRDIGELFNEGNPTLIGTMTCYTTYFVSPFSDTVAHRWMNGFRADAEGNRIPGVANGAVAVHGAGVLSNYAQNGWFANAVLERQTAGRTLGQAVEDTRAKLPAGSESIFNWLLLGDPTLRLD